MALENHPMWRLPKHHLDLKSSHDHVHWVELFYDLIHMVIIFLLGNFLSDNLHLSGFLTFAGLFITVWFAWADSSVFNSLYVSTDVKHRLIMACQIVTAMIMAASVAQNSKTAIRQAVQKRFEELITPTMGERLGQQGLLGAPTAMASDLLLSGGGQADRIRAAQEQLAPILSRRMTPDDLMRQAQAMERAAPGIQAARETGEATRANITSGLLGAGMSAQSAGLPSPYEMLTGPR